MEEVKKGESHTTSAAAFVEGGIQEACDDACSICLETFSESDPSTETYCKHEYHLQCILEWCQRSSNCPMCWQNIKLKDPESQELLEAVAQERSLKNNPLPRGISNSELEEHIFQHLAAAAMGRAHHFSRRERLRNRPSSDNQPQFLVLSTHPNASRVDPISASQIPVIPVSQSTSNVETPQLSSLHSSLSGSRDVGSSSAAVPMANHSQGISFGSRSSSGQSSMTNQENAGPSDFQSFSDALKTRFGALSMKYRESFSKNKRGWKERLFSRSTSLSEIGSEVRREVNAGLATVSRIMERLETQESNRSSGVSVGATLAGSSVNERNNHVNTSAQSQATSNDVSAAFATRSQ